MKINLINPNFEHDYAHMLLTSRGVEDVDAFLNPTREHLQPPTNLKGMAAGAAMYLRIAQSEDSRILIVMLIIGFTRENSTDFRTISTS